MDETRQSLLLRAQTGDENAWKDLTDLYRPLIIGWLRRQGVAARDLDDLSQEILLSVVKYLPSFEHSGCPGRRPASNRPCGYRRWCAARSERPPGCRSAETWGGV